MIAGRAVKLGSPGSRFPPDLEGLASDRQRIGGHLFDAAPALRSAASP
jgi:hypothetical protein